MFLTALGLRNVGSGSDHPYGVLEIDSGSFLHQGFDNDLAAKHTK